MTTPLYPTLQSVFNAAYKGLAAQGFKRSIHGAGCAFRGLDNMRCALGHCIPDEDYHPTMDAGGVPSLATRFPNTFAKIFSSDIPIYQLADLQTTHDGSYTPLQMKLALTRFATHHSLSIPEVKTESN